MLNPPNATPPCAVPSTATAPNPALDAYLSTVAGYLRDVPPSIREGELQELAGHLGQIEADLRAEGHSAPLAASLAIGRFGEARRVGLRLRDVWEGNRGAGQALSVTLLSNWFIQTVSLLTFFYITFRTIVFDSTLKEALTPFFIAWIWTLALLFPAVWNFLLGRWGGRRIVFAALVAYSPLAVIAILHYSDPNDVALHFGSFSLRFPAPNSLLTVLAAGGGAWAGSVTRRRQRWATIQGAPLAQASVLLRRRSPWRMLSALGTLGALTVGGFAVSAAVKARVNATLHPSTPEAAVRIHLSAPGMNPGDMDPSTNVATRLLPPNTAQERAGLERRVAYTATLHATLSYRQRRLAYYNTLLKDARTSSYPSYPLRFVQASIKRLTPSGYTLSRVARVRHTAQGWEMDTSGDTLNDPSDWLYNVLYNPASVPATPLTPAPATP